MIKRFKVYPKKFGLEIGVETKLPVWSEGQFRILQITYHHFQFLTGGFKKSKESHFHLQVRKFGGYKNKEFDMLYTHTVSQKESIVTGKLVLCKGTTSQVNNLKDAIEIIKNQSPHSIYNIIDKTCYQVTSHLKDNFVTVKKIDR